jgi:hypothetical protein
VFQVFQAELNRVANDANLLGNGWVNQDPGSVPVLEASLNQPDGSFNHLDLTKEGTDAAEIVMTTVLKQSCSFRRYAPVMGIFLSSLLIHLLAT